MPAAFGECRRCNITLLDAAAWRIHQLEFHAPLDEMTCLFCGRVFVRDLFRWHACPNDVFSVERHPSNGAAS